MRTPHDGATLQVALDEIVPFTLPAESYAVINLKPGYYKLTGTQSNMLFSTKPAFTPVEIKIMAGQRTFLYTSARTTEGIPSMLLIPGRAGVIPVFTNNLNMVADDESRVWKECSELDAQGFMSILKEISVR